MPMGKSVNLRVRPVQSTDLCYTMDGIISFQVSNMLGTQVSGFDVRGLYQLLGETITNDDSRLKWDSYNIYEHLFNAPDTMGPDAGRVMLSHLRNANEAADLDRAIAMRQNAYFTSYSPKVLKQVKEVYHDDPQEEVSLSRYRLLKNAERDIVEIRDKLKQAYHDDSWDDVVRGTRSVSDNSATQYSGAGHIQFEGVTDTNSWGYDYRYPLVENDLRYHQSRAAVRQEIVNAWRMSEMCDNAYITFPNELYATDLGIRRLQTAYIDTFLFSRYSGIVTALYHADGDFVRAGEPVLRVETDDMVYLVGTLKYRGMLRIGTQIKVTTALFEIAGAAETTITGKVVAVRSHDSVSEQWEVLILATNRDAGKPIFPLNYSFEFESTTIEVLGGP